MSHLAETLTGILAGVAVGGRPLERFVIAGVLILAAVGILLGNSRTVRWWEYYAFAAGAVLLAGSSLAEMYHPPSVLVLVLAAAILIWAAVIGLWRRGAFRRKCA